MGTLFTRTNRPGTLAVRSIALALVALVLTAQTGREKHLIMCNNTHAWVLFQIITSDRRQDVSLCRKPDETSTYSYTSMLHTVDVHALKNPNCVGPGIGRAYIQPNAQQQKEPGLIVAFEGTYSRWKIRWMQHRPGFRCESRWNQ